MLIVLKNMMLLSAQSIRVLDAHEALVSRSGCDTTDDTQEHRPRYSWCEANQIAISAANVRVKRWLPSSGRWVPKPQRTSGLGDRP